MDSYSEFQKDIEKAVESFKAIPRDEVIRVVSHFDADGISAASLIVKALNNDNRRYSLSVIPQIKREVVEELSREPYTYFIFTDLGSGVISNIEEFFSDKKALILDHHEPEKMEVNSDIITFVNPHKFDIDGGKEVSGAGVVYLFVSTLDEKMKDYAHVAIIGAMGDMQENNGFEKLNTQILETAISRRKIKVIRGLRLFGAQTRPLYKVLEYCTDPYIPGVSGSESGSIQFLQSIGIDPRNGKDWKKIGHLTEEEMKNLVTGVIMRRMGEQNPDDVLGNVYLLREEEKESPTKDVKEFATLLNACGRLEKASLGIGACLGDEKIKKRAIRLMADYKKEIISSLKWYDANKDSGSEIITGSGYLIINAQDNVRSTIIGTLASIISKSNNCDAKFIMSMAQAIDGTTKVSLRLTGRDSSFDLKELMSEIVADNPAFEGGGHASAAGAIIPTELEDEFISKAKDVLERKAMEEVV